MCFLSTSMYFPMLTFFINDIPVSVQHTPYRKSLKKSTAFRTLSSLRGRSEDIISSASGNIVRIFLTTLMYSSSISEVHLVFSYGQFRNVKILFLGFFRISALSISLSICFNVGQQNFAHVVSLSNRSASMYFKFESTNSKTS